MHVPIEIVNKIFSYISSPTSLIIKDSIYYHDICLIRYLNHNEDMNEQVRDDYLSYYNTYLQLEYILIDYCIYMNPSFHVDMENLYSYTYRYIFQRGLQQKMYTMWVRFISIYEKEKMKMLQNYLKWYPMTK